MLIYIRRQLIKLGAWGSMWFIKLTFSNFKKLLKVSENFWINKVWYNKKILWLFKIFYPLELIYIAIITCKKFLYRHQIFTIHKFNFPIIVVGNVTVGGTGKTPMVVYIANYLQQQGMDPIVVMRGYKGIFSKKGDYYKVSKDADPWLFGDEPVLVAKNSNAQVFISKDRMKCLNFLSTISSKATIVICDDGLQDYRFVQDLKIMMIDTMRWFGVAHCLPLGPLREPIMKIKEVDLVIKHNAYNQEAYLGDEHAMLIKDLPQYNISLVPAGIYNLLDHKLIAKPEDFSLVHAVAGIGNNARFFGLLNFMGIKCIIHEFPDHYNYQAHDLAFNDHLPIIMTEKDAIKCQKFAKEHFWYQKVIVTMELDQVMDFEHRINKVLTNYA